VKELEEGIGDSDVRAGIIKLAPDAKSGQSRKVCRAAVEAAKRTGACITTHSCRRSRETFDLLTGFGLPPEKLYIGHADFVEMEENEYACKAGAHALFTVWGIDRFIPDEMMYRRFVALVEKGYTENVLLSVDFAIMYQANGDILWTLYDVPGRTHAYLHATVIPKLKADYGLGDEDLRTITEDNPREMLDFR
jgi:predicted metal-dependent phosphotriesterase family hydrolase